MRRERRGERSEDRRGRRREDDPGPKYPDWFRAWGVIILAVYVSVSAVGFVDPVSFFVYMSCSLNSLKGVIWGLYRVAIIGLIKGRILAV